MTLILIIQMTMNQMIQMRFMPCIQQKKTFKSPRRVDDDYHDNDDDDDEVEDDDDDDDDDVEDIENYGVDDGDDDSK